MAPFYGWGSIASRLVPLRGGSLFFTTKFPDIPGTHFIDLGRMKGWVDLGATQWFWTQDPWIGNPGPQPLKESIRMMNSQRSDTGKINLIEEGKKIGINGVIKRNEIINNNLKP